MVSDQNIRIIRQYEKLDAPTGEGTRWVDEDGRVWKSHAEQYPITGVLVGQKIGDMIKVDNSK